MMTEQASRRFQPQLDERDWDYYPRLESWVHKSAQVGDSCHLGRGVVIGAAVSLGNGNALGNNVRIDEGVRIGDGNRIMDGTALYPGTRVGNENVLLEHTNLGRWPEVAGTITRKLKRDYPPLLIGHSCLIGPSAKVYAGTTIGDKVSIYEFVTVREECRIGDEVVLAPAVTVNYQTTIGARTRVMHATHLTGGMVIEEDVFISLHVGSTNDSMIETVDTGIREWKGAAIRRGAVIGAGTMLSPNVEIGQGAHIGMQSVVTKDIPPFTLAVGAPARVIKSLSAAGQA